MATRKVIEKGNESEDESGDDEDPDALYTEQPANVDAPASTQEVEDPVSCTQSILESLFSPPSDTCGADRVVSQPRIMSQSSSPPVQDRVQREWLAIYLSQMPVVGDHDEQGDNVEASAGTVLIESASATPLLSAFTLISQSHLTRTAPPSPTVDDSSVSAFIAPHIPQQDGPGDSPRKVFDVVDVQPPIDGAGVPQTSPMPSHRAPTLSTSPAMAESIEDSDGDDVRSMHTEDSDDLRPEDHHMRMRMSDGPLTPQFYQCSQAYSPVLDIDEDSDHDDNKEQDDDAVEDGPVAFVDGSPEPLRGADACRVSGRRVNVSPSGFPRIAPVVSQSNHSDAALAQVQEARHILHYSMLRD